MKVYLVREVGYDTCWHYGLYSTRKAAEELVAFLNLSQEDEPMDDFVVTEYDVDPPRRSVRGAWCVEMNPGGKLTFDAAVTFCEPDNDWGSGVLGAHWWTQPKRGVRAVGIDREEALARAREMLGHPPQPPTFPEQQSPEPTSGPREGEP